MRYVQKPMIMWKDEKIHLYIKIPENCKAIRFDPMEAFCRCKVLEVGFEKKEVEITSD